MLNADYKEQAMRDLTRIDREYTVTFKNAINSMERLQNTRMMAVKVMQNVERYVISIANRPRDYDMRIGKVNIQYKNFLNDVKRIEEYERRKTEDAIWSVNRVAGVLGGAGIATIAPTAAMSIAMTFGTASTGTAIASLSGAAATNAALAWLGGGALAAGGAGMVGGQVLLTLAGPVGWAISGISLAGSLAAINMSNKEIARKTEQSIVAIKKEKQRITQINIKVTALNNETKQLSNLISRQLTKIIGFGKRDYSKLTESQKNEIISLLNSTEVMSKKLREKIR